MAIPTSYTEDEFKAYLHGALSNTATALGWTVDGGNYDEILNDTLLAVGETVISGVDNSAEIKRLRMVGKREVWKAAVNALSVDYDFSADGGSYSRSQMHKMASQTLARIEDDVLAAGYDESLVIGVAAVTYHEEVYEDWLDTDA